MVLLFLVDFIYSICIIMEHVTGTRKGEQEHLKLPARQENIRNYGREFSLLGCTRHIRSQFVTQPTRLDL